MRFLMPMVTLAGLVLLFFVTATVTEHRTRLREQEITIAKLRADLEARQKAGSQTTTQTINPKKPGSQTIKPPIRKPPPNAAVSSITIPDRRNGPESSSRPAERRVPRLLNEVLRNPNQVPDRNADRQAVLRRHRPGEASH